jgi:hypothetical protein
MWYSVGKSRNLLCQSLEQICTLPKAISVTTILEQAKYYMHSCTVLSPYAYLLISLFAYIVLIVFDSVNRDILT